jgi:serine/threonine protein kinase
MSNTKTENVDLTGQRIGDMVFLEPIGSGGQAHIWKAKEHGVLDREVAAKVVVVPFTERGERLKTIQALRDQEAKNWPLFARSPYVLQLYSAIEDTVTIKVDEELCEYLVIGFKMEYSPEGDLDRRLKAKDPAKRLRFNSKRELRSFLLQIAEGLKSGHDFDVLHCDMKAENILLFKQGAEWAPKIMDFGISITSGEAGTGKGTPEYMAPELFAGGSPDKSSDVYSLGILFYYITCGHLPFERASLTDDERRVFFSEMHQRHPLSVDEVERKAS